MAKFTPHPAFARVSGKSGGLVFRRDGVMAQTPLEPVKPNSPAQLARQNLFFKATAYASGLLADPLQRRAWKEVAGRRGKRPQLMLVADFLTAPEIHEIDAGGYRGEAGGRIRVFATDDLDVVSVRVAIQSAGEMVEEGDASRVDALWVYTATRSAPANTPLTIRVTARDRPGNAVVREATVAR